jgi:uncharacterized protein YabE (DUF348 family)
MESKVTVVADATTGTVIVQSQNNPEYGYVKLEQNRVMIDDNGFLKLTKVTALVQGHMDILKVMGYHAGQTLSGKIVVKESLTPFNTKEPSRDIKVAGKSGIRCTVNGQPIYRKTVYSTNSNVEDILVQHDNVEELRDAYYANASTNNETSDFTI